MEPKEAETNETNKTNETSRGSWTWLQHAAAHNCHNCLANVWQMFGIGSLRNFTNASFGLWMIFALACRRRNIFHRTSNRPPGPGLIPLQIEVFNDLAWIV